MDRTPLQHPAGGRRRRVLVIAVAEATLDLIERWAADSRLPNLARLMRDGSVGRLRSQTPPVTPQLWGTIVTGRSPGHHGIFDFWQRGPDGQFGEVHGGDLRQPTVWSLLSQRGRSSAVLNVPFTYPPAPLRGFMISGEDAPGAHRSIAHPPGIFDEVVERFGRYRLKDIFPGGRRKSDYLGLIPKDVRKQTDVFEHLLSTKDWDFGLVFFSATATAQHYFWSDMESGDAQNPYVDVIADAYRAVDGAIGRLISSAGPEANVFIVSECGAGPLRSGVQMNTVLEKAGLLHRKPGGAGSGARAVVRGLRQSIQGTLNRHGLQSVYHWTNRRLGRLKNWVQSYLSASDIDWTRTKAFSRGKEGEIYLNLAGRDPQGIVMPGADEAAVGDAVIAAFEALVDPGTGEKAVARVHRRENLYRGPMLEYAPDLVVEWQDFAYMPTENERDRDSVFVERWREYMEWPTSGAHRENGVFIACGPDIVEDGTIDGASILDLMPTWLAALGEPVPEPLEGRVLDELFAEGAEWRQTRRLAR